MEEKDKQGTLELLEFKNKFLKLCNVDKVSEVAEKLFEVTLKNETGFYENFLQITDDSRDWLQALWQYYEADRTDKKQDYTPKSLCRLVSALCGDCSTVYDCCGGSGALTLQVLKDKNISAFYIEELDEKVIPFLLFNLCLQNASGYVYNKDVLSRKTFSAYRITSSEKFSKCEVIDSTTDNNVICDAAVSNPPYNIEWNAPTALEAMADGRFPIIPPASNANYAFVMNCLSRVKNKVVVILPNGSTSASNEKEIREYLVESDLLETVIMMPGKMFEVTSIPTCVLVLNKNKAHKGEMLFIDCRGNCIQEEREQNGQFGGNSHTGRTYKRTYNVLSEENTQRILSALDKWKNEVSFCSVKTNSEISENDYILTPSQYIESGQTEFKHRDLQEIADNVNFITKNQNACKLVINETIAKSFGFDVEAYRQSKKTSEKMQKNLEQIGVHIDSEDYVQFTKNKNEFAFKCNDKEVLPDILIQFLTVWKNQIAILNTMQNYYIAELRDALLPDLMSGKIEL